MSNDLLSMGYGKKFGAKSRSSSMIELKLRFDGYNEDIVEPYFWHLNFAYYVGKGYKAIKVEDYHYFSENSQFGTQMRQLRGGSINAFQQNMQQLIQLIRNHLMPLLKEIKQAAFYKEWFDKIMINDNLIQEELKKSSPNQENLKKWRGERNEAINHMKDNWVNNVDGGRLWQLSRSANEQGLDFALVPQLFMGVNLDDPLQTSRTLKEQLDDDIYPIDVTVMAKEQVARFMYRFYTWLPTAINDTQVTFKLKISALKNIYAQVQMYVNFMKPLLVEITRKSEGLEKDNFYRDFDMENPEFVNLFDYSYSFVKIMGIRKFERDKYRLDDLEFTKNGLFVTSKDIMFGPFKGKTGFIVGELKDKGKYLFYPCEDKNVEKIDNEKIVELDKPDMRVFPVMIFDFTQKRRTDMKKTQQGPAQIPFMRNHINYTGYVWNLYEIATYRESLKVENLSLLESFIDEIKIVKDDLIKYANYFDNPDGIYDNGTIKYPGSQESKPSSSKKSDSEASSLILGPLKGIGELFSPLVPSFNVEFQKKQAASSASSARDNHHKLIRLQIIEDTWKLYTIFKKTHGFIQY